MINAHLGHIFDKPLEPIARRIKISPNIITIIGFLLTIAAAFTIPYNLFLGGCLIIVSGFFDILDGIVARVNRKISIFGAFLDSVTDRYSDAFLFGGFFYFFYKADSLAGMFLSLVTMAGALIISYARAKAEGLGRDCHVGLMERPERIIFMTFGAVTGWILPVMWIMFILTHLTVVQRIYHVWSALSQDVVDSF
jgi:phosphatidylglycerophosphate synthase